MRTIAALLIVAASGLAQDGTTTAVQLKDEESAVLGGFAAERIDAGSPPEELESALRGKLEEILKARNSSVGKAAGSPSGKAKGKRKKAAKKPAAAGETIKNGLTEGDRTALGKSVVAEINAGHRGAELSGALKKELERLRAERIKTSSTADAPKKKKKKKGT